jgi:transposase
MLTAPQAVLETFKYRKKVEKAYLELRTRKSHFYVYRATSKWDKQRKKPIKTAELLGAISPDGIYTPKRPKTVFSTTKVYEYGNSQLCLNLSRDVQEAMINMPLKDELLALSIIRAINPGPIRLAQAVWEDTYTSKKIDVNLSPKKVSYALSTVGNMVEETYELFAKLSPEGGMLFYDLTSVLSYSKRLSLAERGYNPDWEQVGQIKVALAFSTSTWLPVAVDVFYGALKETKILKYFVERFPGVDLGFVMDRGFKSYKLLPELKKQHIHYIAALMKNSKFLAASAKITGTFEYGKKRLIAFCKKSKKPFGFLYLFEDPQLREAEEEFLLGQVNKGELTMDEYRLERRMAGVFGIVSDLDVEPVEVYLKYKEREEIEQAFDFMKNDLEADKTYLGGDDAVRGYFVVVFLAMRLYFKILKRLRERELVGKVSVREVLYALSKMRMIVETSGREYLCALPKKTEQTLDVFSDLIPMAQR